MSSDKHEKLSALIDNEANRFEARGLFSDMLKDEHEMGRWERYHLIRATLRGELPQTVDTGFCQSLMERIHNDVETQTAAARNWLRPAMGGLAIAASVALVSLVGFNLTGEQEPLLGEPLASLPSPDPEPQVKGDSSERPLTLASDRSPTPGQLRMSRYLMNHMDAAPGQGMSPAIRIVADMGQE